MTLKSTTTLAKRLKVSGGEPWKPSGLQKRGIKFLLQHGGAGLFLDPGAGKTSIILAAFLVLLLRGMTRGMLIIAPRRVVRMVWTSEKGETRKWTDFRGLSVGLLHGPNKDQVVREKHDIYVMTPDGLEWLLFGKHEKDEAMPIALRGKPGETPWKLLRDKVDILTVDETSKFRKPTSKRSVLIRQLLPMFQRRWGATGSPAPNGLLSLYGQVYLLDMGKALGAYFSFYRNMYFEKADDFGDRHWNIKQEGEQRIFKRLKNVAMRIEAGDYIKMPQRVEIPVLVELDAKARDVYDTMEDLAIVQMEKLGKVAAFNPGGVMMKCKQIANGCVYVEDVVPGSRTKRQYIQVHTAKLEALEDLVDELNGQPLLIAAWFDHDVDTIREVLGADVPYMGGNMSDKEADRIKDAWNAGDVPLLMGHPQSIGHGLNMQENQGAHVAMYDVPQDYDLYDQFIRRVQRQGNNQNVVFVHQFIAVDTIDEGTVQALGRKERTQNRLLAAVADFTLARYKRRTGRSLPGKRKPDQKVSRK